MDDRILKIATRAKLTLEALSEKITNSQIEFNAEKYEPTYSKSAVASLPELAKAKVDKAVAEMEQEGYQFQKKQAGLNNVYSMGHKDITAIYEHRGVPKYRDKFKEAHTIFLTNLKGGVAKTVSSVTLAHGLRCTPALLHHDLRILVLDLDPQASATMFMKHDLSIGVVDETVAQAMLQNVSREELLHEFVKPTNVSGVDIIPASIEDAFIASQFEKLANEHLPGQNIYDVLQENIIDKLKHDYDFIFIDSGPHLDAFLLNSFVAADTFLIPVPPAQVDFHSTLKFMQRLPELFDMTETAGSEIKLSSIFGYMAKIARKSDHADAQSLLREVCGADMLDTSLPLSTAFERCGESFGTVFSTNPKFYPGDRDALKKARLKAEEFTRSVFDTITFNRKNKG